LAEGAVPAGTLVSSSLQDALFQGNQFGGLTAGALIYGTAGVVRFEGNIVRECYAGFWLLSLRSLAFAALLDRVMIRNEFVSFATQLRTSFLGILMDPIAQVGSAIARTYPIPEGIDLSQAVQVEARRASAAPPRDQMLMQNAFERLSDLFVRTQATTTTGTASPSSSRIAVNLREAAGTSADRAFAMAPALNAFTTANLNLSAFERQALAKAPSEAVPSSVHLVDNDIDVVLPDSPSSVALVIWDDERETQSMATIAANKIRGQSALTPVAMVVLVERCAVTGNLVLNEQQGGGPQTFTPSSFFLFAGSETPSGGGTPIAPVTITGNVFRGLTLLPPRPVLTPPVPPPLDKWDFFNTQL